MRSPAKILIALAAALCLANSPGVAQEAPPAAPEAAPAPALPDAPIPYRTYTRETPAPAARPRPAPRPAAAAAPAQPTAATPLAARLTAGEPIPPEVLATFVDGIMSEAMAQDQVVGAAVSVVQNGQVILKKGYGQASLVPLRAVDPDRTLFRIGSISKTFTWITLMQEVERGRMRLDGPVNLYLPERLQIPDQGYDEPIRLGHLMTHTPGFEDRALSNLFEFDPDRERPIDQWLRQERPARVRAPGTAPAYSNYGVTLAGKAASHVAGMGFEQLVEERITRPAGLFRTTFREPHTARAGLPAPLPAGLAADLSDGFSVAPEGARKRDFELIGHAAPAGSASSTAGDMARYMILLLNGGVLDGATIYGPRTAGAFATSLDAAKNGGLGWRHGFMEYALPGGRTGFGHGGDTLYFHSNMVMVPELGLGIFITTNTDAGWDVAGRLPSEIVRRFYGPSAAPAAGSPALVEARGAYEGAFLSLRRPRGGLEGFMLRLAQGPLNVSVSADGKLVLSGGGVSHAYVLDGEPLAGRFKRWDTGQPLVFEMKNGEAHRIVSPLGFSDRVPGYMQPALLIFLAMLTAIAALATLVGLFMRDRRDLRETPMQQRASLVQTLQAALWLSAFALLAIWAVGATDHEALIRRWPGGSLVTASACALLAAALSVLAAVMLPWVLRGGRRLDSWSPWRRLRFTLTTLIYLAFSVVLALWGALEPWTR